MGEYQQFWGATPERSTPDLSLHFEYTAGAYTHHSAQLFIDGLEWESHTTTMMGQRVVIPRLIAMYGSAYNYTGIYHPAKPLHPLLHAIQQDLESRHDRHYNSVLCNLYRHGKDAVGWHSDNDYSHKGQQWIASVSLGATRRFRVRHKATGYTHHWDLRHGDLIIMKDGCQQAWQHTITKTKRDVGPRVNLTYRYISAS